MFEYSDVTTKKMMNIFEFIEKRDNLLQDAEIQSAWLRYCSRFPFQNAYFKKAEQYKNQTSIINDKTVPSKNNLSKVFLEQCFNLLRCGGQCGILLPTSIYSDAGNKQLREMLFCQTKIYNLFGLSNERFIFEGVDHRFKFCLLYFEKGGLTNSFYGAFRIDPREAVQSKKLDVFFSNTNEQLEIPVTIVKALSPDSFSLTEFKQKIDISIASKIASFPFLGSEIKGKWNLKLTTEFDKTAAKDLFETSSNSQNVPLYEGGMIHHFKHDFSFPQYYINISQGRSRLAAKKKNFNNTQLDCDDYRLILRRVARQSDSRALICTIIPKNSFCDNSVNYAVTFGYSKQELLFICAIFCSFIFDFQVRGRLNSNVTIGLINQLSVPRLTKNDRNFNDIVQRAAKLICTTPEFDELAQEVGLGSHQQGITDEAERAKLRAELDGMVAHLYGLTEDEFSYILTTFPIVNATVKEAALEAYRTFVTMLANSELVSA